MVRMSFGCEREQSRSLAGSRNAKGHVLDRIEHGIPVTTNFPNKNPGLKAAREPQRNSMQ